jgi:hypothetical protein
MMFAGICSINTCSHTATRGMRVRSTAETPDILVPICLNHWLAIKSVSYENEVYA